MKNVVSEHGHVIKWKKPKPDKTKIAGGRPGLQGRPGAEAEKQKTAVQSRADFGSVS